MEIKKLSRNSNLYISCFCYFLITGMILFLKTKNLVSLKISLQYLGISVFLFLLLQICLQLKRKASCIIFLIWLIHNNYGLCELILNRNDISNLWPLSVKYFTGIFLWAVIWLAIYLLVGKIKAAIWIASTFQLGEGVFNYYITVFRGSGIGFQDIYALHTAANVFQSYTLFIDQLIVICLVIYSAIMLMGSLQLKQLMASIIAVKRKQILMVETTCIAILIIALAFNLFHYLGIVPQYYRNSNGVLVNMLVQSIDYYRNDYTMARMDALIDPDAFTSDSITSQKNYPNIICIMNESFSDLSVLGDIQTSAPVLPVYDALKDNTCKGYVYASVWGGGTADSEYELLTGDSTAAYTIYPYALINDSYKINALPMQLKQLGYETVAMHAFHRNGWRRDIVYDAMGFNQTYFLEDFKQLEYIHGNGTFASDESQYKKVLEVLRQSEKPVFIFDVTIQNHGGYETGVELPAGQLKISANIRGQTFSELDNVLQLMHESDRALGKLLNELETLDEPVILCMFGDHQPKLSDDIYRCMLGQDLKNMTAENKMKLYMTPYLLWTNYRSDLSGGMDMSINFLGTHLLKEAGMPLTAYNKYLENLYQSYPVITANGVFDKRMRFYPSNHSTLKEIQTYMYVIYNHWKSNNTILNKWFLYNNE